MNWIAKQIRWIMLISGALTCTMLYAAFAPTAALTSNFGSSLTGPVAEVVVRNWGVLIGLVGVMLIYGAFQTTVRRFVLCIAGASKLAYVKADVVIDAVPSAVEIDNALKRLETMARGRALVVGYSSALPASIDRIAKWAKAAQARGLVLIPVSAAAVRARST